MSYFMISTNSKMNLMKIRIFASYQNPSILNYAVIFNIDILKLNVTDHYLTFINNLIVAAYFSRISFRPQITTLWTICLAPNMVAMKLAYW